MKRLTKLIIKIKKIRIIRKKETTIEIRIDF